MTRRYYRVKYLTPEEGTNFYGEVTLEKVGDFSLPSLFLGILQNKEIPLTMTLLSYDGEELKQCGICSLYGHTTDEHKEPQTDNKPQWKATFINVNGLEFTATSDELDTTMEEYIEYCTATGSVLTKLERM